MKFLYAYHGGNVPGDKMEENGREWMAWLAEIKQKEGIRTAGGKLVSAKSVIEKTRDLGGVSIVEAKSMDEAIRAAKRCPGLKYGGTVEVLEEFRM